MKSIVFHMNNETILIIYRQLSVNRNKPRVPRVPEPNSPHFPSKTMAEAEAEAEDSPPQAQSSMILDSDMGNIYR